MKSASWGARLRIWHRWLSVAIGLQLLLWTAGGLIFAWNPIDDVRGTTFLSAPPPPPPPVANPDFDPTALLAGAEPADGARQLRLAWRRGRWAWLAEAGGRISAIADARTGELLAPIAEAEARAIARRRFGSPGEIRDASLLQRAEGEYRGKPLPAWRIRLGDARSTHLYIHALSGEVTAVRNDIWRRYDFFWMLHIMDYGERENFNSVLLQAAAALGVASSATGLCLTFMVFRTRSRSRRKRQPAA